MGKLYICDWIIGFISTIAMAALLMVGIAELSGPGGVRAMLLTLFIPVLLVGGLAGAYIVFADFFGFVNKLYRVQLGPESAADKAKKNEKFPPVDPGTSDAPSQTEPQAAGVHTIFEEFESAASTNRLMQFQQHCLESLQDKSVKMVLEKSPTGRQILHVATPLLIQEPAAQNEFTCYVASMWEMHADAFEVDCEPFEASGMQSVLTNIIKNVRQLVAKVHKFSSEMAVKAILKLRSPSFELQDMLNVAGVFEFCVLVDAMGKRLPDRIPVFGRPS